MCIDLSRMRQTSVAFALAVFGLFAIDHPVAAQQMYVDDKLVLNVHSEANQGGEKVATIETGDQVEMLERVESYARVRLPDGREGWVGANYLTPEAPAAIRLKELESAAPTPGPSADDEAARKKLTEEVTRLKKQNADLTEETSKLKKAAAAAAAAAVPAPTAPVASAEPEPEPEPDTAVVASRNPMSWILPTAGVVVAGVLAFWLGYQTLARRIRRKYGRVNII